MGTTTASILVGTAHQSYGGIKPSHQLMLTENSRPAWSLSSLGSTDHMAVWIPTIDNMLEDGLLMAGLLAVQDPALLNAASAFRCDFRRRAEMYEDIAAGDRRKLYEICRKIGPATKLTISVFAGSTLANQLPVLERYRCGVEICSSVYSREYSAWSGNVEVVGTIPGSCAGCA
jgi:hypothetical protein